MRSHIDFSNARGIRVDKKICFSQTYGQISSSKMNQVIFLTFAFLMLYSDFVAGEYSGRRRQSGQMSADEKQYLDEKLSNYVRKKFLQQFNIQSHLYQHQQKQPSSKDINTGNNQIPGPGFSFELPPPIVKENNDDNGQIQFAVQPFDSRYYEPIEEEDDEIAVDEAPLEVVTTAKINNVVETKNKILIPSPMHVVDSQSSEINSRILHRAQQKQQQQLQQQKNQRQENDVLQKPLQSEFDNTTSIYIVAVIAGLSCAFSTGLIALGLMYWTLKKKVKSADACDYGSCDYGVVGPQIAAGDKKLAHSAQMFHYQHQKNQIIAMENRNGAELSHGDENENDSDENENDFTVYECPGFADSHNMEVKNPLFSEETPATTKTEKAQPTNKTTK